jgi:transposase-like protein
VDPLSLPAGEGTSLWSADEVARPGPLLRPVARRNLPTAAVLMREYVRQGRSLRSVADEYGLSVGELRDVVVGYGLPLHQGAPPATRGTAGLSPEFLQAEYVEKGRSAADLAAEMGVSEQSVLRYLHRYGIEVRRGGGSNLADLLGRAFLEREYVEGGRSAADIAAEVGVSEQSVLRYLHRHAIPIRARHPNSLGDVLTEAYLHEEYVVKGRSVAALAREHGVSDQAIRNWLRRRDIASRRPGGTQARDRLTFAYLHREYEQRGRSVAEIAAQVGVSEQSVLRYLHRHGIEVRRGRPEAVAPSPSANGRGRPAWLDGLLTEELLRREYVDAGRSAADIARQVGASEQSVLRYLHRRGIPVRPAASGLDTVFTAAYLEEQYVQQGRSLGEIGRAHGVSGETVRKWLARHGIERRSVDQARCIDRTQLEQLYLRDGRSIAAIAEELGVSATTVTKRLDGFGIPRRPARHRADVIEREHLEREYVERGRTMAEIATDLGVSPSTVRKHLDLHGIEIRPKNAQPLLERVLSRDFLDREYGERGRTAQDIAREVGVSEQTVLRYLHRHGVPVRAAGFGAGAPRDAEVVAPGDPLAPADPDAPADRTAGADADDEAGLRAWLLGGRSSG